jgi:hypothetical protein
LWLFFICGSKKGLKHKSKPSSGGAFPRFALSPALTPALVRVVAVVVRLAVLLVALAAVSAVRQAVALAPLTAATSMLGGYPL